MRLAFLIPPMMLFAACGSGEKASGEGTEISINADGDSGGVKINAGKDGGKIKIDGEDGTAINIDVPDFVDLDIEGDFDIDGVKMIPGGRISSFNINAGDQGATVNFGFNAPTSADETRAYFADQFGKKGVDAAIVGDSVSGKTKDGDPFVIRVEPAAQGSQGTITIQSDK